MVKTASLCVPSFWHKIGAWQADGQTDRWTDGYAVAYTALTLKIEEGKGKGGRKGEGEENGREKEGEEEPPEFLVRHLRHKILKPPPGSVLLFSTFWETQTRSN